MVSGLLLITTSMIPWLMPEKSVLSTLSVFITFFQNGNRTKPEDEASYVEGLHNAVCCLISQNFLFLVFGSVCGYSEAAGVFGSH